MWAYPVNYSVSGTLSNPVGPDAFHLDGATVTITGTIDSTSPSTPSPCGSACTFNNQALHVVITPLPPNTPLMADLLAVSLTFATGSPGRISLSSTIIGIPFSAVVKVNLTSAAPYAFGSQSIAAGSTVSYGSGVNETRLTVGSGTASATTTAPAMNASENSFEFAYRVGDPAPAGQSLTISAGSTVNFSASASNSWVVLSEASGITGSASGTLQVSVDPSKLTTSNPGTFKSSVNITSGDATNSPLSIPVTFTVTGPLGLTVTPDSALSFLFQIGRSAPAAQKLAVASTGAPLNFTAAASVSNGKNWLAVSSTSSVTPASVSVSVSPQSLTAGNYSGTITLTPSTGKVVQIPVSLTVSPASSLVAAPPSMTFVFAPGGVTPPSQTLSISDPEGTVSLTAAASTLSGANWLSVSPNSGTTPAGFTVSVNPTGLTPNTYNGSITLTPTSGSTGALVVPVTLSVFGNASLVASPQSLPFLFQAGGAAPGAVTLNVGSNGAPASFTVALSTVNGANWLYVFPSGGVTPAPVIVSANPSGLPPGLYTGSITLTPAGNGTPVVVPVSLTVTSPPAATIAPSALAFAYQLGGAAPSRRKVLVSSTGANLGFNCAGFTTSGGGWLTATPGNAVTPANLTVAVNPAGLTPNTYSGTVSISVPGASNNYFSIPVTLTVSADPALAASPSTLSFSYQAGGTPPPAQTVDLAGSGPALSFTAAPANAAWLSVSPGAGSTPGSLSVSVNPDGLSPATYKGSIRLSSTGTLVIPVSLTVTAPEPVIQAITHASSLESSALSQMSIVTVWGTGLGPSQAATTQLTSSGLVATTLANTRVFFDDVPAPMLLAQSNQINAIVPNSVAGKTSVKVQVEYLGVRSAEFTVQIAPEAPTLFTLDDSGKGQGAILNQDSTVNSVTNPAAKNSVVVLYGDGAGQTVPPSADGSITSKILAKIPKYNHSVSVKFAGIEAEVLYSGPAPGQVAGLMQINARIPPGVKSGAVPVTVRIEDATSQPGVTVAVR